MLLVNEIFTGIPLNRALIHAGQRLGLDYTRQRLGTLVPADFVDSRTGISVVFQQLSIERHLT